MSFSQGKSAFKRSFILILFSSFFVLFFNNCTYAQVPSEISDLPIDPNALKNASPAELQNYFKDNNQQQKKAGEDIHKSISDLTNKNFIARDSTQKDNFKKSVYSPEAVYGRDLFQNKQVMELSQLSTPPLDYPIGVGDHIVVSLWGGADFEESYEVALDCLLYTSPSPRDRQKSRMPSSA